ncbi:tRNA1(Val) (adenine(37)-N6)-methyltransferase [Emticicia aquatilis]|uniref:tRNA1(Val) (adenine(37)-N6)-methyltransferase n=1 Tax=Emticicia aquatilis TaxID=1537369 RepID=A0A916Z3S8_9BACT|nr:methyltransferase [Emticicia aquatilis]GGD74735.1 tRNA1(Val) (adenine(37)-N6)-methyltransferase [Emticicia aquatilis]
MPKNSFTFKQFTINQDRCAMKVCTDACILGASTDVENVNRILDIGTGTGLLSLMIAQRTNSQIDAVEIDEDAYHQAIMNVQMSKFAEKISIHHQRIQDFSHTSSFDLIISNPPFYQQSLKSNDAKANKALHAVELSFDDLIDSVKRLLSSVGRFVVLLPPFEIEKLIQIAQKKGLYLSKKMLIRHDESKPIFRVIATFLTNQVPDLEETTLIIHEKDGKTYSNEFRDLLQDYYLIF